MNAAPLGLGALSLLSDSGSLALKLHIKITETIFKAPKGRNSSAQVAGLCGDADDEI
jgi:hypothetical protein